MKYSNISMFYSLGFNHFVVLTYKLQNIYYEIYILVNEMSSQSLFFVLSLLNEFLHMQKYFSELLTILYKNYDAILKVFHSSSFILKKKK